ncbi:GL15331 [Drosophila persimilis]|uniref:GL15331 n=1 Tax=Drosophila persimilis TaxID=7234 RepID=B4H9F6_DROPE|nr:GL15331 [Drosophila persimilis]
MGSSLYELETLQGSHEDPTKTSTTGINISESGGHRQQQPGTGQVGNLVRESPGPRNPAEHRL